MSTTTKLKISNLPCIINCEFHSIQPDPDPSDWFCDDDVKVVCDKCNKNVTWACRPYNIEKESEIPDWCPRLKKLL